MKSPPASVAQSLDDTADVVSIVAVPWAGALALAVLPLRFLQAEAVSRLLSLGPQAARYGDLLHALAALGAAAFVVATLGRAAFARACLLAIRTGERPGREALAVGLVPFLSHLYLALLAEVAFFALWLTIAAMPLAITLAALAAAVAPLAQRASLVEPLRLAARAGRAGGLLLGLQAVFLVALVVAFVDVAAAFAVGLWLAGAVPGIDVATWSRRLALGDPRFLLLVWVGATLVVEPFWLAAHVVVVHLQRARRTGEDLRARFERLRAEDAA